jgi:hypothetical protein
MSVLEMKIILGICKLCGRNSELQNSHIIPEFFYDLIYDSNPRRFRSVPTDPSPKIKYEQQGIREHLLCKICEGKFQIFEDYVKRAFIDNKTVAGRKIQSVQMQDGIVLQNLDYKKFKLFLLSVLWRMSITTRDFFANVSLGSKHEEIIHAALLDEDPLQPEDYPCVVELLTLGGQFYQDFLVKPYCVRGAHRIYMAVIAGLRFSFYVGGCVPPKIFTSRAINQQNELKIGFAEIRNDPILYEAALKVGKRMILNRKTKQ